MWGIAGQVIIDGNQVNLNHIHRMSEPLAHREPGDKGIYIKDGGDIRFTNHSEYKHLEPRITRTVSGSDHSVIVDGRKLIDPDAFINAGFIYKGIGRGDKNNHTVI